MSSEATGSKDSDPKSKSQKEKSHHPLRDNIEIILFAVTMALGLKVFAIEAYQIPTGSMQPTLMGTELYSAESPGEAPNGAIHDRVLVDKLSFLLRDPVRWEVVVFRYPLHTNTNYVKRLVGMPGETLLIENGNVFRDVGPPDHAVWEILRKPASLQEHIWKRVFPTIDDMGAARAGDLDPPWNAWSGSGNWNKPVLKSGEDPGESTTLLAGNVSIDYASHRILDNYVDGYPDAIRDRIQPRIANARGQNVVGDLKVEFEARDLQAAGSQPLQLRMDLGHRGVIEFGMHGRSGGELWLSMPDGETFEQPVEATEDYRKVSLAFWDHRIRLQVEGGGVSLDRTWDLELESAEATSTRITFKSTQGEWEMKLPSIWRDIYYLPTVRREPIAPIEVPEGHYFMLGDNTQNSLDSRDWRAITVKLREPVNGRTVIRGDEMSAGQDPMLDNPRQSRGRGEPTMTVRDEFGGLYSFPKSLLAADQPQPELAHFVPREYIIGKALLVFLPVPPFSPVVRLQAVH